MDWDAEYAFIITATGWTWEYIDEFLTLPRLNALRAYWLNRPPVHITAALFAGIRPPADVRPDASSRIDNAAVVREMKADPRALTWQTAPMH